MSGLGDFINKAEQWAEENPDATRKGIDQAEQFAQEQTGHRFDDQISSGADQLSDRLTGGGQDQNQPNQPNQQDQQGKQGQSGDDQQGRDQQQSDQ